MNKLFNVYNTQLSREENSQEHLDFLKKSGMENASNEVKETMGIAVKEKEHCVVARITNFSQLKKAKSAEIQEQYQVKIPKTEENMGEATIRVRKVTYKDGTHRYELTTKSKVTEGKVEHTIPTTKENFIQFKVIAESGMLKHRYSFPIEGTEKVWEIDAYPDGNGGYYPWVRCEIEVEDLDERVPQIPIETEEVIMPPKLGKLTQEEYDVKVHPLYQRFFITKNPYLTERPIETKVSVDAPEGTKVETKVESDSTQEKPSNEATGKEEFSIDNITDDKERAKKVEARAEQIKEARGDSDDEFGTDTEDTTEDNDTGESEGSDDTEAFESNETEEDDEGKTPDEEDLENSDEVSTEGIQLSEDYLKEFFGLSELSSESNVPTITTTVVADNSMFREQIEKDLDALRAAEENIKSKALPRSDYVGFEVLKSLYYKYLGEWVEVDETNYSELSAGILGKMAQLKEIDEDTIMSREDFISSLYS